MKQIASGLHLRGAHYCRRFWTGSYCVADECGRAGRRTREHHRHVADTITGRDRIIVTPDDALSDQVTIDTDRCRPQYNGFGGTINGAPNLHGLQRFQQRSRRRPGRSAWARRRRQRRSQPRHNPARAAGRRPQTEWTDAHADVGLDADRIGHEAEHRPDRPGRVEGVLQQINAEAGRLVIVTDQREVLTVRTPQRTPVRYHGDTYRISNLEVGDVSAWRSMAELPVPTSARGQSK